MSKEKNNVSASESETHIWKQAWPGIVAGIVTGAALSFVSNYLNYKYHVKERQEEFSLTGKREVYQRTLEVLRKHISSETLTEKITGRKFAPTKNALSNDELNDCLSSLALYSNIEVIRAFNSFFLPDDRDKNINAKLGLIVNLMRNDLNLNPIPIEEHDFPFYTDLRKALK